MTAESSVAVHNSGVLGGELKTPTRSEMLTYNDVLVPSEKDNGDPVPPAEQLKKPWNLPEKLSKLCKISPNKRGIKVLCPKGIAH